MAEPRVGQVRAMRSRTHEMREVRFAAAVQLLAAFKWCLLPSGIAVRADGGEWIGSRKRAELR